MPTPVVPKTPPRQIHKRKISKLTSLLPLKTNSNSSPPAFRVVKRQQQSSSDIEPELQPRPIRTRKLSRGQQEVIDVVIILKARSKVEKMEIMKRKAYCWLELPNMA